MHRLKPLFTAMLILATLLPKASAFAQSGIRLNISDPMIDSFPKVSVFVQVRDETGKPLDDFPASGLSLLEDNQVAPDLTVDPVQVGTRLVYALNTSPALRIRDTLGRSRYELILNALLNWWALPEYAPLGVDDLSLITAEGIQVEHTQASAEIASVLANLKPSFESEGDFELLFRALDLTNAPAPISGMPSYIFFITPLLRPSLTIPLESIIARAQASQTTIIPILVGPPEIMEQAEVEAFQRLAVETGGSLLLFESSQGLQNLAQDLIAQRTQYQLTYRSPATTSGPHEITVRLSLNDVEAEAPSRSYILELLAPEVTLLNLPGEILRSSDDPTLPLEKMAPATQAVEFAVQFPDGYPRPVIQAQLLDNGEIVDQRLQPPFSPLTWDLRNQLDDATHELQVTVLDSLGLQANSPAAEIGIRVELPPRGLAALRPALSSLLLALGVLLAGVALAAILLTAGRRTVPATPSSTATQQVAQPTAVSRMRRGLPDEPIEAYLYPLEGDPDSPGTIYLTGMEINIGRDPNFAAVPLDDPSVDGLHARIIRHVDGSYFLRDQGSKAGTWVHYKPLPETGQKLAHGDIVHFGRSAYRFAFVDAPPQKEIRRTPLDEPIESSKDNVS
ncbi:MAG: FHA domain-containing protein [Anaerolineales bacterium]|nr:FHA domain-containing protein [Anaerolineales bacterium]